MSNLIDKTVAELRLMASKLGINRYSKLRKDQLVSAIEEVKPSKARVSSKPTIDPNVVNGATFEVTSQVNQGKPMTVRVSCGASYGDFPVVGKSVGAVMGHLLEVLNISKVATPYVNGKSVENDYVLKSSDTLEFLKPAGSKG